MAGQPYDYRMQYVDPVTAFQSGRMNAQAIQQNDFNLQQGQAKAAADQAAAEQAAVEKSKNEQLFQKYIGGDNSVLEELIFRNPSMATAVKSAYEIKGAAHTQDQLKLFSAAVSAIDMGRTDVALSSIDTRIAALNQNPQANQEALATLTAAKKALETGDPVQIRQVRQMAALNIGILDEKAAKGMSTVGDENRAQQLQPSAAEKASAEALKARQDATDAAAINAANIGNKNAGASAALSNAQTARDNSKIAMMQANTAGNRLQFDQDQAAYKIAKSLEMGVELSPQAQREMFEVTAASSKSLAAAASATSLAAKLRVEPTTMFGKPARTVAEWFKLASGRQDGYSVAVTEYKAMRNIMVGAVAADYKPMSNSDITLIASGFPPENAEPEELADYLDKFAKAQTISAEISDMRAEWLSSVGNLGTSRRDVTVMGISLPKGSTLAQANAAMTARRVAAAKGAAPSATGAPAAPALDQQKQATFNNVFGEK